MSLQTTTENDERPPDNPATVERVSIADTGPSIQFDGDYPFHRDGDYFEVELRADETARPWRDVRAADLAEELAGNDAVPILVRSEQGGETRGEISEIDRDGERVTVGAYTSGTVL